jgi:hypothetical protein
MLAGQAIGFLTHSPAAFMTNGGLQLLTTDTHSPAAFMTNGGKQVLSIGTHFPPTIWLPCGQMH